MSLVDQLRGAKERLIDENHWERGGGFASDAAGKACDPDDPAAVAFCAIGAIVAASGSDLGEEYVNRLPAVQTFCSVAAASNHDPDSMEAWLQVAVWNDETVTHEELIAAFDRAILYAVEHKAVAA